MIILLNLKKVQNIDEIHKDYQEKIYQIDKKIKENKYEDLKKIYDEHISLSAKYIKMIKLYNSYYIIKLSNLMMKECDDFIYKLYK